MITILNRDKSKMYNVFIKNQIDQGIDHKNKNIKMILPPRCKSSKWWQQKIPKIKKKKYVWSYRYIQLLIRNSSISKVLQSRSNVILVTCDSHRWISLSKVPCKFLSVYMYFRYHLQYKTLKLHPYFFSILGLC